MNIDGVKVYNDFGPEIVTYLEKFNFETFLVSKIDQNYGIFQKKMILLR